MTQTNESNCILSSVCINAGNAQHCNRLCPSFIAMHGTSGNGGRVGAANVPKDYRLITVQTSPVRANQTEVYKRIDAYVATFKRQFDANGERIKSLYLWSESPGTGKTTTASSILNEWLIRHYVGSLRLNRQPSQFPAYLLDANAWQTLYNGFARQGIPQDVREPNAREYYRQMEQAKKAPFAVLDDIGVRESTDGFRGDLHSVINYRVTEQLPTVYTSNIPMEALPEVFGEGRLYDRMRDQCLPIEFVGESRRGMRR